MTRAIELDDAQPGSLERARPQSALIERINTYGWQVALRDGEDAHTVAAAVDYGDYVGRCDCKGYLYHAGPCAHLVTLRLADRHGVTDTHDQPVQIEHVPQNREEALAQRE